MAATRCGQSARSGSGPRWRRRALTRRGRADPVVHRSAPSDTVIVISGVMFWSRQHLRLRWGRRSRRSRSRVIEIRGPADLTGSEIWPGLPTNANFALCAPAQSASADALCRIVGPEATTPAILNSEPPVFFAIRGTMNDAARTATASGLFVVYGVRPRHRRDARARSPMARWHRWPGQDRPSRPATSGTRSGRRSVADELSALFGWVLANPSLPDHVGPLPSRPSTTERNMTRSARGHAIVQRRTGVGGDPKRSRRPLPEGGRRSAEGTLDWARTLVLLGIENIDVEQAKQTLHILLKYQSDIEKAAKELTVEA